MKLEIGLKFKKYYNDDNINNVNYCEVRAIVDETQIVLFCNKNDIEYYELINIFDYEFHCKNNVYIKLN